MQKEIMEKYLLAGKIAAEVREESKKWIVVGSKLIDIAEKIEAMIREKGAAPAFPVNLSLNDVAAHYTPIKKDETKVKEGDILKVDIGVHVDGYVGDTAYTISFGGNEKLVEASESALNGAIKLCKPGTLLSDISAKIEETIHSYGFNPISNLTGHGLEQYNLHAEPQIPNIKFHSDYKLKENQVIAIEPFATNGSGYVKESDLVIIFRLVGLGAVRNNDGRAIMRFATAFNGLPFAERWIPIDSMIKIRIAMRELREKGIIYDYPILKESAGGAISQAEHTVIIKDEPVVTTK
ncbi:MAG: type II methionyl aminopeptidase [Candidatus Aenigmatarchaeota archaeon]